MANWTINPNTSQNWTSPTGGQAALGGAATTSSVTQHSYLKDSQKLYFGTDLDFSISYNNSLGQLLFHNSSGDALLTIKNNEVFSSSTDIFFDLIVFNVSVIEVNSMLLNYLWYNKIIFQLFRSIS